jgi:hypothetical protein
MRAAQMCGRFRENDVYQSNGSERVPRSLNLRDTL